MPNMPWFRFYSETLNDRKIKRICSATGQPKALIVGVWATILALANDSPERGKLMISDGLWMTHAEIMEETGLDHQAYHDIMAGFEGLGMTTYDVDTGLSIANWEGRQFKSDHSSPMLSGWQQRRNVIMIRDGEKCRYCGKKATEVDHIIPRCQGGTDEMDNLVAACFSCNRSKGGRTPEQAGMVLLNG